MLAQHARSQKICHYVPVQPELRQDDGAEETYTQTDVDITIDLEIDDGKDPWEGTPAAGVGSAPRGPFAVTKDEAKPKGPYRPCDSVYRDVSPFPVHPSKTLTKVCFTKGVRF